MTELDLASRPSAPRHYHGDVEVPHLLRFGVLLIVVYPDGRLRIGLCTAKGQPVVRRPMRRAGR